MIPLRDANPSQTRPVVTLTLILANVLVFFYQLSLGPGVEHFFREFGVVPADILGGSARAPVGPYLPLVTSIFLHGGWLHLIGNMLFLWIFGDNVEDRLGHGRFLVFYLAGGLMANLAHLWANGQSTLPTIGASGAVAAVLGAYACLYPRARVMALVPLGFFMQMMELPAMLFLGGWFGIQILSGTLEVMARGPRETGGIAWWAHIGGFGYGFLVALFVRRRAAEVYVGG